MAFAFAIIPIGFDVAERALTNVKNGAPKAITEAINRGLTTGRKTADQLIRARYNISSAAVKSEIVIKKATWGAMSGELDAKGPMLPVSQFSPSVRRKRIVRRGPSAQFVSVTIIRGSRKLIPGAFMVGSRVMERRQPERYPIFPVSTIGIPFMVGQQGISEKVQTVMAETVDKRLIHNIDYLLSKA